MSAADARRICILGGAGFIGANLVRWLLANTDAEIDVVDNLWTGLRSNVPDSQRVGLIEYSVEDLSRITHDSPLHPQHKYDVVFHLASPASPVWYTPEPIRTVMANVVGAQLATEIVKPGGLVMYTSTSEAYGDPLVSPQPESYRGSVSTTGPRASYDEGKRCAEALLTGWYRQFGRAQGTRLKIARIFNCYGPFTRPDDGRAVSNFLNWAMRGERLQVYAPGTQTRCFGHVRDILQGLLHLTFDTPDEFVGPLNVGLDDEISVVTLAEFVCQELFGGWVGWDLAPATPDDPQQRRPDLTLCRQVIPMWQPKISWRDGVADTLEWFRRDQRDGA